ncbi:MULTISPECIES: Fur family transcriptional regulator [unclassified Vibrio]|uniref:Ferric uptake regulation protein n=1 Tax=Vibrio sp. HB236076 TaxID=3232307 RepID=A0AB39HBX5_9VIBR|nr:Fur family transcriptional regulator [Vibrio sp. HB161653]MDP5254324.1 Fur family transcriptional regulator [Vibrio sp. HB161653]
MTTGQKEPNNGSDVALIDELEEMLRAEGVRITQQRMAILAALASSHDHPNIDELHERAKTLNASVSLATVYRTVTVLEERGALIRNEFEGASTCYELANKPHHDHLIDVETGKVVEFCSEEIEALQETIAKELGYDIVYHRLELYVKKRR